MASTLVPEALDLGGAHSPIALLPFAGDDTTAGAENELQVAVHGARDAVDLPLVIATSNFFQSLVRRTRAGEIPRRVVARLEHYLAGTPDAAWENSWVRFPRRLLTPFADQVLEHDCRTDRSRPDSATRSDVGRFLFTQAGEPWVRVPVSYALRLALAHAVSAYPQPPAAVRRLGERLMAHYLNDNSSPETHSFHVVGLTPGTGMGRAIARETSKRFLLTQLLTQYTNARLGLAESGQRARVYFAPHPPIRQKALNALVPDAFYRELFMNPCLAGWDRGEDKHRYMVLCHQVLSRSHLNAVVKLRDAGIITRNLVVLPSTSNVSLANNGTHLSLGSRRLTDLLRDPGSGFGPREEKRLADLVIKVVEHFLPLFVGTYSAAPYRLDFADFHPERALGFLPHELDFTHLRMVWRRWKKKARLRFLGHPVTPLGPVWLDRAISAVLGLRGDFVPDFRLIDYLVALLSTEQSPALDGHVGNGDRLRRDLAQLGVFDEAMSVYLPYKPRAYHTMGFSGYEGRHYSVFASVRDDFADAATLQCLLTALAHRYVAAGTVDHGDIPDSPAVESERRQIFFGAAIGLPTFFVRRDTQNRVLARILELTARTRPSRRYPGYLRVHNLEYRRAALAVLRRDAPDLIEATGAGAMLDRLARRIEQPDHDSALGKLTRGILDEAGASTPLRLSAEEFNTAAEAYYRDTLRRRHLAEGLDLLREDVRALEARAAADPAARALVRAILGDRTPSRFFSAVERDILDETAPGTALAQLIHLTLLTILGDAARDGVKPGAPPA